MNCFRINSLGILLVFYIFSFFSCELIDDEHCNYTSGKVITWTNGDFVLSTWVDKYEDESTGIEYGFVPNSFIGGHDFVSIDNICTSKDAILNVKVDVNPNYIESLGSQWQCFLMLKNGYLNRNLTKGRFISLRRKSLDESVLRLENVAIPVIPDFKSETLAGNLRVYVMLYYGEYLISNKEEWEANSLGAQVANELIKKVEISVDYTVY